MIRAERVGFEYSGAPVLDAVDLAARPGEVLGLIGPNGSGKSTLLRCLHGELTPTRGSVLIDETSIDTLSVRQVARRVGVVAQESSPIAGMSVPDFVLLGRTPHRSDLEGFTSHDRDVATEAMHRVGALSLVGRRMDQLSGGERQRVAIARCLAQETEVLLLDEPTNHLDIRYQHEVLRLVKDLGMTTVLVLHDLNLAARFCDRVALLHDRRIVSHGSVEDVLQPEVLEHVYGMPMTRLELGGRVHLLFGDD